MNEAFTEPLTKEERDFMGDLSAQAYGNRNKWQKLLRKGDWKQETPVTSNGMRMRVSRKVWLTVQDVKAKMEEIIANDEKAQLEAETKNLEKVDDAK